MRSSALALIALTGCVGVHLGHAPAVPYPITERDLLEAPAPSSTGRLPAGFGIPVLRSVAPDPVGIEFSSGRQVIRADRMGQAVPATLLDGFHSQVGGRAGGTVAVTVVIERLFTGCYPVHMGTVARGQHSFVEAFVDFGDAGGERVRFALHEPGCMSADDAMLDVGRGLAAQTVALAERVQ